jgi:DNA-binding NtrC family response regulator
MIKFYKHSTGEVPEILNLKTKLRALLPKEENQGLNLVQVSDQLTRSEEVVVVKDIATAIEVNSEHPTARVLLSVENPFSLKATEISKLHNYGISALYLKNDLESGVKELSEAFEKKKDISFSIRQEEILTTINEKGLLQVAGFQNDSIIGQSQEIRELLHTLAVLKNYNEDVLFLGEAGVGKSTFVKELAANAKQQYFPINITELSEELFASQLFGYLKGSFTGAMNDTKGILEQNSKGMIFFDEMGDLTKGNQVKLLTVLQDRTFRPVGESKTNIEFKGRFIFATNQNMDQMVEKGQIRQDFLSRLRRFVVKVPSLQERREDIGLLVQHYLSKYNKQYNKDKEISINALDLMGQLRWRENVRQLENLLAPIVLLDESKTITADVVIKHMRLRNDPNIVDNQDLFVKPVSVGYSGAEISKSKEIEAGTEKQQTAKPVISRREQETQDLSIQMG